MRRGSRCTDFHLHPRRRLRRLSQSTTPDQSGGSARRRLLVSESYCVPESPQIGDYQARANATCSENTFNLWGRQKYPGTCSAAAASCGSVLSLTQPRIIVNMSGPRCVVGHGKCDWHSRNALPSGSGFHYASEPGTVNLRGLFRTTIAE